MKKLISFFVALSFLNCSLPTEKINSEKGLNTSLRKETDHTLELYQSFSSANKNGESLSEVHSLGTDNTTSIMLSAYSLDKTEYTIYYRLFINGSWKEWTQLMENPNINPNRKVYKATPIHLKTQKVQFKSSTATKQEVLFRFYLFS